MATPDDEFYWDWYKHEEALATNRGSFFLLGQSMLFAAYAALRVASSPSRFIIVLFSLIGLMTGIVWLAAGIMHLIGTRGPLVRELDRHEPRRAAIASSHAGKWPPFLRTFHLMALVLPSIVCLSWILLAFA